MQKAVLFDVDGTIVDTVDKEIAAWHEALQSAGLDITETSIRKQIGKGGDLLLPALVPGIVPAQIEAIGTAQRAIFRQRYLPSVQPFPLVADLFQRLYEDGFVLGLASSGDRADIEHYQRLAGIEQLVRFVASSDEIERSKPAGDVFFVALRKLGFATTRNIFVVGDTPYDALAAREADLPTIGVLGGAFDALELLDAGCISVFRDVADLFVSFGETPFANAVPIP